jgi:propanediol dehydratase small subunit
MILVPRRIRPIRTALLALVLAALAAAVPAAAQTVVGRALDRETQQPIADASVALVDADGEAVATGRSGADGSFRLTARQPGAYRVTATRIGYRTLLSSVVTLGAGAVVEAEVRVTPQPVTLDTTVARAAAPAGISGQVLEAEADRPVAGATVSLLDGRGLSVRSAVTGADGRFHLRVRDPGGHRLRAQRVGFQAATSPVMTVTPGDTLQVEMRMSTGSVVLAPLTVVAASRSIVRDEQMAEFDWRREHQPWGRYVGPEEIERINPFRASDVLQQVPFVHVQGGHQRVVTLRAPFGRGRCLPTVYVDGHFVATSGGGSRAVGRGRGDGPPITLDEVVAGTTVAAVEVYDRPSMSPAEFAPRGDCGVIVIWTRPPGSRENENAR